MQANKFQCGKCQRKFQHGHQLAHHQIRGCRKTKCTNCGLGFHRPRDLRRHEQHRKFIECTHCDKSFCNNEHFQKHLRTIAVSTGSGVIDYNTPINDTGYEDDADFQALLREKRGKIDDYEKIRSHYKLINRKIDSSFSYRDLGRLLSAIYDEQGNAFKLNIGFGSYFCMRLNTSLSTTIVRRIICCLKRLFP